MDSQGNIRYLAEGESPRPDEIRLPALLDRFAEVLDEKEEGLRAYQADQGRIENGGSPARRYRGKGPSRFEQVLAASYGK